MRQIKIVGGAMWLALTGAPARARNQLYHGRKGLRILTFHDTPSRSFDQFRRVVDEAGKQFEMVGPEGVAEFAEGVNTDWERDRAIFAFDDGFGDNFAAAEYLAKNKIRAIFFIVPSFLDRTVGEYTAFHRSQGTEPFGLMSGGCHVGLTRSQAKEMVAMGHLIGGHNFAHRDLSVLSTPQELEYEIDRALDGVAEITGKPCEDFAFAFGRPNKICPAAAEHLQRRCPRVYSCVRGLNVAGISPRILLRDNIDLREPLIFHRLCMRGGVDMMWVSEVEALRTLGGTLPAKNHVAA